MSLYNEMRPASFEEVVGQEKTVEVLKKEILDGDFKNAYLFTGVRGTGKTTSARIMAAAMNCEHVTSDGSPCGECKSCKGIRTGASLDVYELDAASNNSVEDIRRILEQVQYKATAKRKVFILDEVHMLSNSASNALLKVLEEPPENVSFILCTTEENKVLPTIRSRCSVFVFEKITRAKIAEYLQKVCTIKQIDAESEALSLIAKAADGAMRDALSILDQMKSIGEKVTAQVVSDSLGLMPQDAVFDILEAIADADTASAFTKVRECVEKGAKVISLVEDMIVTLLDAVDVQLLGTGDSISGSAEYQQKVVDLAFRLTTDRVFALIDRLREVLMVREKAEVLLISTLAGIVYQQSELEALKTRVEALEKRPAVIQTTTDDAPDPVTESIPEEPAGVLPEDEYIPDLADCKDEDDGAEDLAVMPPDDVPVMTNASEEAPAIPFDDGFTSSDEASPFDEELPSLDEVRAQIIAEVEAEAKASSGVEEEPVEKKVEEQAKPVAPKPQSKEMSFDDFARQFDDF